MSCLLADVGGTRTRFALLADGQVGPIESLRTGAYASMHYAAHHFLNGQPEGTVVDRAVIAAAGLVAWTGSAWPDLAVAGLIAGAAPPAAIIEGAEKNNVKADNASSIFDLVGASSAE